MEKVKQNDRLSLQSPDLGHEYFKDLELATNVMRECFGHAYLQVSSEMATKLAVIRACAMNDKGDANGFPCLA